MRSAAISTDTSDGIRCQAMKTATAPKTITIPSMNGLLRSYSSISASPSSFREVQLHLAALLPERRIGRGKHADAAGPGGGRLFLRKQLIFPSPSSPTRGAAPSCPCPCNGETDFPLHPWAGRRLQRQASWPFFPRAVKPRSGFALPPHPRKPLPPRPR